MIILFQTLFLLFSFFAIYSIIKKRKKEHLSIKGVIFWASFWILADVFVLWPNSTTVIANKFGIGRGSDFVFYISLILIFYLLFKLHVKIESVNKDITELVRKRALEKLQEEQKKQT